MGGVNRELRRGGSPSASRLRRAASPGGEGREGKKGRAGGFRGEKILEEVESGGGKTQKNYKNMPLGRNLLKTLAQFGVMWYNR